MRWVSFGRSDGSITAFYDPILVILLIFSRNAERISRTIHVGGIGGLGEEIKENDLADFFGQHGAARGFRRRALSRGLEHVRCTLLARGPGLNATHFLCPLSHEQPQVRLRLCGSLGDSRGWSLRMCGLQTRR